MKFNREHLEELTLQKIKEVNDEAGYRSYLEVPEMVNIIASIMEEKFNVLFDSQKDQIRGLRAYNDILEKENDSMTDIETSIVNKVITAIGAFVVSTLGALVALTIIAGLVPQLTWNHCLIGAVDGVHPITFLQAWGLNILCGMLFCSVSNSK